MNLRKFRLAANLQQSDVVAHIKTTEPRFDVSLYSKIENHLCLPTVTDFRAICELIQADPNDIYCSHEVDFGLGRQSAIKTAGLTKVTDSYKLTVRVPVALASGFNEALREQGYPSVTAWVCDCIRDLKQNNLEDNAIGKQ